jgi:hypothetical protein
MNIMNILTRGTESEPRRIQTCGIVARGCGVWYEIAPVLCFMLILYKERPISSLGWYQHTQRGGVD